VCKKTRLCILNESYADAFTESTRRFYRTLRTDKLISNQWPDRPVEFVGGLHGASVRREFFAWYVTGKPCFCIKNSWPAQIYCLEIRSFHLDSAKKRPILPF
jgi:hypothetical protein